MGFEHIAETICYDVCYIHKQWVITDNIKKRYALNLNLVRPTFVEVGMLVKNSI